MEARAVMPLCEDQVSDDFCGLDLNSGERHPHLKCNARFFRKNDHTAATPDLRQKQIIEFPNCRRPALEMRFQVMLPAKVRLVAISELPATRWAAPQGF